MRNPFDLTELDNAVEEQQAHIDISAYQSHDGNRSLLQNENRRGDNLKDRFIGAIDQGTTSSRFIIFDCTGVPVAKYQTEFRQIHEHSGWHEHDPLELVDSVYTCIEEAMKTFLALGHSKSDIEAIGITSQRETTLCWDWETGEPLHNAIAWPDTRTKNLVRELKGQEGSDELPAICGLPLSTYPSSVSLVWLLRHSPKVKQAYDEGRLAFGTVDSWLLYNLNGGPEAGRHVTDVTNASRTMFMNLETLQYDDKLLKFFGIDRKKIRLPKILPSSDPEGYGYVRFGPLDGVPITSCLGDQSAALVGHCAFTPGTAKNTYGTGCFLLYNVGEKPVISKHGLLATVGFQLGKDRKPVYALEGSVAVAGSGISFLMNNLGFFRDSRKVSDLAATVPDSGGCVFVTAFSGLFAPYWIDDAKGTIFGITQHTQRGHIARATMEAACFQTKAILDAMARDSGHKLSELAVDGGMSNSDICMQTQADIIQIPVERPAMHETTALGAAIAAGFAIDVWKEFSELKNMNRANRTSFTPRISPAQSARMYKQWSKAVEMSRGWLDTSEIESEGQE
ncbi:glycerol kinase [Aspergillus fischeri NRRL 181]|uniref:glycerol kinase n=1 Tax=Neosartorya fischeri (strain ATCC 1020 / DSM 3700 / CBS 544.65 / FGSC A1164 / JCM 1740 / NRRL 181 / WB 181) TaxID=331117 RepID=A1CWH6_NEOFI|nr:glycerol kinase, putative [Aspergillus fischeri NRRL 181]EAW24978.1 glycerol kinase, putative [Aspergillus fischeri NRRL 181]